MNKTVQTREWYEELAARHLAFGEDASEVLSTLLANACPDPETALQAGLILAKIYEKNDATCAELLAGPKTRR